MLDPKSGELTDTGCTLPYSFSTFSLAIEGDVVYFGGSVIADSDSSSNEENEGNISFDSQDTPKIGVNKLSNKIISLSIVSKEWVELPDLPALDLSDFGLAATNKSLYVIGGQINQTVQMPIYKYSQGG